MIAIIINPLSGGARPGAAEHRAAIAGAVAERCGEEADVLISQRVGHARQLARDAAARGARLVLAWGGDGTINEVASALAFDKPTALGIVPAGSGNGLATELGISRDPEVAIASAVRATPRPLDVGTLDDHLFVNVAGIGIDAYVAAQFNDPANLRRGLLAYARITGRALVTYAPADYRITADDAVGGKRAARAVLVTIANGAQYGNNARIAPQARFDDGLLDLVVVEERSRLRTLTQVPRLFNGTADRVPGCTITRIRRAVIECERPMTCHVDGEPLLRGTRVVVQVHPAAIRIAI